MANLTNNKPKDTYPRLVQIEQGRFQNGLGQLITGSIVALHVSNSLQVDGNTDIAGNLIVTGSVRAKEFITTVVSSSVLLQSGSTISGNSLDDTHTFTGSLNLSGSVNITGSAFNVKVNRIALPNKGTSISMTNLRTSLTADTSGSGIQANVSVEDNDNGSSIVKIYGDRVLIGSFTGSSIAFGNQNTVTFFEGSNSFLGSVTMMANRLLNLNPSTFSTLTPGTGSLAVTGSSFAYYDGDNWQYMQTGSFALLSDHLIATASITNNEANINNLTSATSSYALKNQISGSLGVNAALIRSLTGAVISGSFTATSASLAASIATNETNVGILSSAKADKNSISGSFAIESAKISAIQTVVSASALLNLTPSNPLPTNINTGSIAVTGSTLAFYDGNNWKVVVTGSTLPL